ERAVAVRQLDHLVGIDVLIAAPALPVLRAVGGRYVDPGAGEQVAQGARLLLVGDRMEARPRRDPLEERRVAPLADQAQHLAVQAAGLVEAVVEVQQRRRAVADGALDMLLDRRAGPDAHL